MLMTKYLVHLYIGREEKRREETALNTSSFVFLLVFPLQKILPQVSQLRFYQVSAYIQVVKCPSGSAS